MENINEKMTAVMSQSENYRNEILYPSIPMDIEELPGELKPKARYIGPGFWYKTISKLIFEKSKNPTS